MAANTYGRQVVIPLTNKSGGSVALGDVVVIDTANNNSFTTTTSAGFTGGVGVAQETIANNAVGRILTQGYTSLVNTSASVTRGQYGATHTVAKQAAGQAARGVGTFCQFLTGGATTDALVFPVDLLGSSLTNPMTTTGDIIYSSDGSGTPARLAGGTAGKFLTAAGAAAPAWGQGPLTTTGDLLIGATGGTPTRLAGGTAGYPLVGGGAGVAPAYAPSPARRGCLVYHNTTQTVNGAGILFNSEIYDTDAYHSTVTNTERITIPAGLGGLYLLEYGTNVTSVATGEFCRININSGGNISLNEGDTNSGYISGTAVYPLVATDYVQVIFTGNRTVGHASAYEAQSHFSATLLGT